MSVTRLVDEITIGSGIASCTTHLTLVARMIRHADSTRIINLSLIFMNSRDANTSSLEDFKGNIKIKLSALWASVTFFYIYGDYFELYVPGKLQGMINGNSMLDSPVKLFAASLLLAIPALMVCLSVLLKPGINRKLNLIVGVFFTAIMLLIAVTSIAEWRVFYVFYAIAESMLTSVIVVYAWKWTRI